MTFSYNAPGVTDKDTVRFYVQDTVAPMLLSDEEIEFLIGQWSDKGSLYYVAAAAADTIATRLTREIDITSDGQSLALSQLRDRYKDLGVELRAQHEDALVGGSSLYAGGMDAHESPDPSVKPLAFGRSMHDHPEAGQQDYGDAGDWAAKEMQWGEAIP